MPDNQPAAKISFPSHHACEKAEMPCAMVVFGGSGDLAARKLVPALYRLYHSGLLPPQFALVGCGRTSFTDDSYREHLRGFVCADARCESGGWDMFAQNLHYQRIDYATRSDAEQLADRLGRIDDQHGTSGNRLFYMAVPPTLYESVIELIRHGRLKSDCTG